MRHKKHKLLHKIHSIPIINNLCKKKRLFLVSYSIPLSCMVVLLLGSVAFVNPSLIASDRSYAVEVGEDSQLNSSEDNTNVDLAEETLASKVIDEHESMASLNDTEVVLITAANTPTMSLTVTNTQQSINASPGGSTAYGAYEISLTGDNVKNYMLSMSAGSTTLSVPGGSATVISGANGKTGVAMDTNTWGYSFTDAMTSIDDYGELTYYSPSTTAARLANGTAIDKTVNLHKKLIFAAKFSSDATQGKYSARIILSAIMSADDSTIGIWSNGINTDITTMQEISSGFCKNNANVAVGDTITLVDARDNHDYAIVKLPDNNCWMQQNLALSGRRTLTKNDSNVSSDWTLPADTSWGNSITGVYVKTGSTSLPGWHEGYGNYYSWQAALANGGEYSSYSICPKGWTLPTMYNYKALFGTDGAGTNLGNTFEERLAAVLDSPYRFVLAGDVNSNGELEYAGTGGSYWTKTRFDADWSYYVVFNSARFDAMGHSSRYYGYPVRCVASY